MDRFEEGMRKWSVLKILLSKKLGLAQVHRGTPKEQTELLISFGDEIPGDENPPSIEQTLNRRLCAPPRTFA